MSKPLRSPAGVPGLMRDLGTTPRGYPGCHRADGGTAAGDGTGGSSCHDDDLAPYTRFTLITGIAGETWADAAAKVARDLGVPLEAVIIGPGREVTDIYYDWARIREVAEEGALLVRPDKHIGWRSMGLPDDPEAALREALTALLSRLGAGR